MTQNSLGSFEGCFAVVDETFDSHEALRYFADKLGSGELNEAEIADTIDCLHRQFRLKLKTIAKAVPGLSYHSVRHYARVGRSAQDRVKSALVSSKKTPDGRSIFSFGHARAIASLAAKEQIKYLNLVINEKWSVSRLEKAVRNGVVITKARESDLHHISELIEQQVGWPTKVTQSKKDQSGDLIFHFNDNEHFGFLVEKLGINLDVE